MPGARRVRRGRSDVQEPLTDLLAGAGEAPEPDDEAYRQVRVRVQSLIAAARALSDTCADLADALRPVPGHLPDDPLVAAFGRLRAERTAALLDEAASAARGTLGLLHSAYGALDRRPRPVLPAPRSGPTTWPDAFVEVPTRGFTLDEEAGTAVGLRSPWAPAQAAHLNDATDPHGIPAITAAAAAPSDPAATHAASPTVGSADGAGMGLATGGVPEPAAVDPVAGAGAAGPAATDGEPIAGDLGPTARLVSQDAAPTAEPTTADAEPAAGTAEPATDDAEPAPGTAEPAMDDAEPAPGTAEPAMDDAEPATRTVETATGDAGLTTGDAELDSRYAGPTVGDPVGPTIEAAGDEVPGPADAEPIADAAASDVGPAEAGAVAGWPEAMPGDAGQPERLDGLRAGTATAEEDDATEDDATEDTEHGPEDVDGEGLRGWATTGLGLPAVNRSRSQTQRQSQTRSHRAPDDDTPEPAAPEHARSDNAAPENASLENATPEHASPENASLENAAPVDAAPVDASAEPTILRNSSSDNAVAEPDVAARLHAAAGFIATEHSVPDHDPAENAPLGLATYEGYSVSEGAASEDVAAEGDVSEGDAAEGAAAGPAAGERAGEAGDGLDQGADGTSVEDTDADDPTLLASAALAGWMVVDPDDVDDPGRPIQLADTGSRVYAATAAPARVTLPIDTDPRTPVGEVLSDRPSTADTPFGPGPAVPAPDGDPFGPATDPRSPSPADPGAPDRDRFAGTPTGPGPLDEARFADASAQVGPLDGDRFGADVDRFGTDDTAGWHGDTVSAEPRSLSLVPPPPDGPETATPTWGEDRMPSPADPWAAEPVPSPWPDGDPMAGADLSGAAMFARVERPVWTAEPVPGSSVAGDGVAVFPISAANTVTPVAPSVPLDEPAAAVISRQVEAARRHLQAALVVANGPSAPSRLGALLTAIEQVLTAVTDLARETRGVLEGGLADRAFPGEARFLCSPPWDGTQLVGRDAYGDDVASPAGLAKLLRALGYEAHSVTASSGAAGVQIRDERYAMQVALVEPAGGGRQRWSGALEWVDGTGASRTWAETIGPVELEDEELARRVDELLRRSVGA